MRSLGFFAGILSASGLIFGCGTDTVPEGSGGSSAASTTSSTTVTTTTTTGAGGAGGDAATVTSSTATTTGAGGSGGGGATTGAGGESGTGGGGGCMPYAKDGTAIGSECTMNSDCPDGYTCWSVAGIVVQQYCAILCTSDCECPSELSCLQYADKAGTWMECAH